MTKPYKQIKNNALILLFSLLAFSFQQKTSNAQEEVKVLTLDDAIEIARLQSPDALLAKHRFRASYWQFRKFKAAYLPEMIFEGNLPGYNRSIISDYDPERGTAFYRTNQNEVLGRLSLNQRIGFTGGDVSLSSDLSRIDNFITDSSYYRSSLINLTYTQPIFNYNRYKWERKIEPMYYKEAKQKYIEEMEQVSVQTTNRFFSLLQAQIEEEIAIINQANYDTLYKIAKGRYNLGKIAENDLLQLELQYLRANSSVKEKEVNYDNQLFNFKSYLRIKEVNSFILEIPNDIPNDNVNSIEAIEFAKYNNSTSLGFQRRLVEAESQVSQAKYEGRFDANLIASYGIDNSRQYIDELSNNPSDSRILRLGFIIPILDWGVARGDIKMALSNQEIVRTTVEQDQIDFDQEVFLLVTRFNMQYDQIVIAAKADTVAQKGYEITKARYLIGRITITDLNIAQAEANSSKGSYINELWNYWRNYYNLRRLTLFDFENKRSLEVDHKELL